MYGDELSQFDSKYILFADSDLIFTSFDYLAGNLVNEHKQIQYFTAFYNSTLKDLTTQQRYHKQMMNYLLGVDNQREFMFTWPVPYLKSDLAKLRNKIVSVVRNESKTFMDIAIKYYYQNRVCKHMVDSGFKDYGLLSQFNLMIGYKFYYGMKDDCEFGELESASSSAIHLSADKHFSVFHLNQKFTDEIGKHLSCSEWYCYQSCLPTKLITNFGL